MTSSSLKKIGLSVGALLIALPVMASETGGTVSTGAGSGGVGGTVVAAPTASPSGGTYTSNQSVTLSASGSSSIRYSLTGTPACPGTGTLYASAVSISSSKTLQAIACYPNSVSSTVSSFAYVLQCATDSVTHGSVSEYPTCSISCSSGYKLSGGSCIRSTSSNVGGGGGNTSPASPPTTPQPTTGGGGLSAPQVQSIVSLLQAFGADQSVIASVMLALTGNGAPATVPPAPTTNAPYQFTRFLKMGMTGDDVRHLQMFLNAHGFPVASTGQGSAGNETTKFGVATRTALIKYQESHPVDIIAAEGLSAGSGLFYRSTLKVTNAILAAGL